MIGNKATVLPLRDYRGGRRTLYFTRSELNQLLGLYSRNVARGVWRDYAIDHRDGQALFSVFRHTHESAAYTIVKTASSAAHPAEFIVLSRTILNLLSELDVAKPSTARRARGLHR